MRALPGNGSAHRRVLLGLCFWAAPVVFADGFVDQLTADEMSALGVDRMTPAQIATLEAAVERFAARPDQGVAAGGNQAKPAAAEPEPGPGDALSPRGVRQSGTAQTTLQQEGVNPEDNLPRRRKVLLRPGTEIEYTQLESRLIDPFSGWSKGTRFRLENGQVWRVVEGSYVTPAEAAGKAVRIVPGMLGSFIMEIEGVRQRPRVALVTPRR